ncbi:hypothetical protein KUCAC02_027129, partial [Chaenocephalus aceratus]
DESTALSFTALKGPSPAAVISGKATARPFCPALTCSCFALMHPFPAFVSFYRAGQYDAHREPINMPAGSIWFGVRFDADMHINVYE